MAKSQEYIPIFIFTILLIAIFLILGPSRFNKTVKGSSETLSVRTENDFVVDPGLVALPAEDIVAVLLESQDCNVLEKDTGGRGYDIIPYRYAAPMEQTFCWEDDNRNAGHYMVLVNDEGEEVLQVNANGACVTKEIGAGDYELRVYHDAETKKNVAVFIVPENGKSTLSTASGETLENISTFLDTDRCEGCDLSGANLYNADLRDVDLEGAKLNDAILANANLSGANLKGAELRNADLTGADMTGANLAGANLAGAIFINSDLTDANLLRANLENADLTGANITEAQLTGAVTTGVLRNSVKSDETVGTKVHEDVVATITCTTGAIAAGAGEDLDITGPCTVGAGTYHYRNVHIYNGGSLTFDDAVIHFWAYNILVENNGSLIAGSEMTPIGAAGGKLTIHLYGEDQGNGGKGVLCKTGDMCGVDSAIWNNDHMSKQSLPGPVSDFFYQYHHLPVDSGEEHGYFGYKTLAVSYNGTLRLFGKKGATLQDSLEPSSSGKSWVRLKGTVDKGATQLTVDRPVDWEVGDRIVVTTTDYLPGHSEVLEIIAPPVSSTTFNFKVINPFTGADIAGGLQYKHHGETYPLTSVPVRLGLDIKVDGQPAAETRAAVALLSRSIRIVSGGDTFNSGNPTCDYNCFPAAPYHFGGHTSFRQGFKEVKIQGVEFYQLGQGGRQGHYPVHFHMARLVPVGTFVKDSSIWDSMTRFITLHATQGVTLARNVGYMSIGHGYYLEDGTEINNKLYSNIGIFARAAVDNVQNPRKVPGILAYTADKVDTVRVPYHSDYAQPAVFWIMNGWNDIEYNMAAGATACGICYWWLPGAISGPSQGQKWEGYASQQSNLGKAGDTPLKNFKGNYCTTAMSAFNTTADISQCLGVGGPGGIQPVFEPITTGNLSPAPNGNKEAETYYPKLGNLRHPTRCNNTDCSTQLTCSATNRTDCMVAVLDKFTTAFNWAQTNFSAIWLRPQWYLVINSVISDVQSAGLTFVTGGDYTQSNFLPGMWQLARQNVFIGNTQTGNPYASNIGPVNKDTTLTCENQSNGVANPNYCLLRDEGITFQLTSFANNQRLFNIYDGPSFEDSNAFLNVKKTVIDDCKPTSQGGSGNCSTSKSMYGRVQGMPLDKAKNACSIPNAAIAWKQSNGFYYPPAFHSSNLYFGTDVEIRHFVIEPLFKDGAFSFQSDDSRVKNAYCTYTLNNPDPPSGDGKGGLFDGFTAIDRQTILNDDDGSLTGYKNTISVNEDSFFNAPAETLECESEGTAKTSPYDYVTTVVYPGCVANKDCGGVCKVDKKPCADDSNCASIPNMDNSCDDTNAFWMSDCGSSFCYGVPLYRQFLNQSEASSGAKPQIRMMGMNFFQRSNLTANHGKYYIDTTVSRENQRNGMLLAPLQKPSFNVFTGYTSGEEYYVVLIFAKDTTKQTYQLYVGKDRDSSTPEKFNAIVHAIRSPLKQSRPLDVNLAAGWPSKWIRNYNKDTGILEITVDLSDFKTEFDNARMDRCKPESFCTWTGNAGTGSCGCSTQLQTTNPDLYAECTKTLGDNQNNICSWAVRSVDCPEGGCYGFAFTLPAGYNPPAQPVAPPETTCFPNNSDWNVNFSAVGMETAGSCFDANPPKPNFCASGGQGGEPTPEPTPVPTPVPTATPPPLPPSNDKDNDGVPDDVDADADNDGIPNSMESGSGDTNSLASARLVISNDPDGDGIPNEHDLDSDGDGLPDHFEGGGHNDSNSDGTADGFADTDGDGLHDAHDPDQGGNVLPLPDTDSDGLPDFLDTDSDNDGITDTNETAGCVDANGDGELDDSEDTNGDGLPDSVHPATGAPCGLIDSDGDGIFDHLDATDDDGGGQEDEGGGNCAIAGGGSGKGGLAGMLLIYSLIPMGILIRRRKRS